MKMEESNLLEIKQADWNRLHEIHKEQSSIENWWKIHHARGVGMGVKAEQYHLLSTEMEAIYSKYPADAQERARFLFLYIHN